MMCITEGPTGHLLRLFPLVFELCKPDEDDVVIAGQFVVPPLYLRPAQILELNPFVGWIEYVMDYPETVIRRKALKVGLGVPLAHVLETT